MAGQAVIFSADAARRIVSAVAAVERMPSGSPSDARRRVIEAAAIEVLLARVEEPTGDSLSLGPTYHWTELEWSAGTTAPMASGRGSRGSAAYQVQPAIEISGRQNLTTATEATWFSVVMLRCTAPDGTETYIFARPREGVFVNADDTTGGYLADEITTPDDWLDQAVTPGGASDNKLALSHVGPADPAASFIDWCTVMCISVDNRGHIRGWRDVYAGWIGINGATEPSW